MRVGHRAALPLDVGASTEGEGPFLPSDHTVADVLAYVEEHPDQLQSIYDAEQAGKARVTLLEQLEARA